MPQYPEGFTPLPKAQQYPDGFTPLKAQPKAVTQQSPQYNTPELQAIRARQAQQFPSTPQEAQAAGRPIPQSSSLNPIPVSAMHANMIGVDPATMLERFGGAASGIVNNLFPAGDTPRPSTQGPLTPEQEIGAKIGTLGMIAPGAESAIAAMKAKFPSVASAGSKFEQIMNAAKDVPIDTTAAKEVLAKAQALRERGSVLPKVMNDFAKATNPIELGGVAVNPSITYEAGRDFASNAGALSQRETTAMNAKMQRQVAQFGTALKDANREAAVKVGMGDLYDSAMKEYRQAKTLGDAAEVLKKWGVRALAVAAAGSAGAAGVKLYQDLTK